MSNNPPIEAFRRCVNCGCQSEDVKRRTRYNIYEDFTTPVRVTVCADEAACRQRWAWRFDQTKRGA